MTPYQNIYSRFLRKISDYSFIELIDYKDFDDILYGFLENSIPKFDKCDKNLFNKDEIGFLEDLNDYEQDILSSLMILEWLNPQIYSIENTKQYLGDKDYKFYSQANHIKELLEMRKTVSDEAGYLINRYINRQVMDKLKEQ